MSNSSYVSWFRSRSLKSATLLLSLAMIFACVEYGAVIVGYFIEYFLIEKKDITDGRINAFYVGMKRSSVIAQLEATSPSSVEAEPGSSFEISDETSEEWKKLDGYSDIGVTAKSGDEILIRLDDGRVRETKHLGVHNDLRNIAHANETLPELEAKVKQQMARGIVDRVFPVLLNRPDFVPVADLKKEGYLPLLGYNGWQIRYKIANGDDIYDISFYRDRISRIRYEHPLVQVGE